MMQAEQGLFKQINNTVLDLQAADLQSYPEPLKRLGRLLSSSDLKEANQKLLERTDLEAFLHESASTQGGMMGSAELKWPDDDDAILGLKLALVLKFAEKTDFIASFGRTYFFNSSNKIMAGVTSVINQLIIPFVRDYREYVESNGAVERKLVQPLTKKVFIVHGHDGDARESVARFLQTIGFTPIILNEQANKGRTIIEKIEGNSDVSFAVVLLTPDDEGRAKGTDALEYRARQNVLLELGYFIAHLGRQKVCALKKGDVNIPSDFAGVVWETMDEVGGWKLKLARELIAVGHKVDVQKIL